MGGLVAGWGRCCSGKMRLFEEEVGGSRADGSLLEESGVRIWVWVVDVVVDTIG